MLLVTNDMSAVAAAPGRHNEAERPKRLPLATHFRRFNLFLFVFSVRVGPV